MPIMHGFNVHGMRISASNRIHY